MTTELFESSASKREIKVDVEVNSKPDANVDVNVIDINDDDVGDDEYSLCLSMLLIKP